MKKAPKALTLFGSFFVLIPDYYRKSDPKVKLENPVL